jgi:hypothetical protein
MVVYYKSTFPDNYDKIRSIRRRSIDSHKFKIQKLHVLCQDREFPMFSVVLSRFYDFHIDTFIYKGSAAIIGYCGLLTTSECVPLLLSSNDNLRVTYE